MQSKRNFKLKDIITIISIFLISCLYFLSYFNYDMNIWDEGVPLNGALRMFRGERPIRDFFAYPPGRYILYYVSMKIGGLHVRSPRILQAFLSAVFAALIWLIGRKAGLKKSAVIPWVIYLLTPMYYYYRFFTFSLILMIISLALLLQSPNRFNACVSAGLALIICWLRIELGMILLALFPLIMVVDWIVRGNRFRLVTAMPSILLFVGQVSLMVYVGGAGAWLHYLRLCANTVSGGVEQMSLSWPYLFSLQHLRNNDVFSLFQGCLFYVAGMVLVLSGLSIIRQKQFHAWSTAIVLTGFIGFGLVVWRTGFGNLLRCLPPISILAVWLITKKNNYRGIKYIVGMILFIGLSFDSLIKNPHIYQSIGVMRSEGVQMSHPRYSVKVFPSECRLMSELVDGLEQLKIRQYRTMMALPFHPLLNFITDLQNTSYYEWLLPGMFKNPLFYQDMLEEVGQHAPDIFIINDIPFDDLESRRFSKQYPELMIWILNDYYRWERFAGFDIYRRKPPRSLLLSSEFSGTVLHAEGVNKLSQIQGLFGGNSEILIQECGSEIHFEIPRVPGAVFYSAVLFESSYSSDECELKVEIRVNNRSLETTECKVSDHYAFLTAPILGDSDEPIELELVTLCSEDCSKGLVIWMSPAFLELDLSSRYVDRYCTLP